jgi:hypothetical protein
LRALLLVLCCAAGVCVLFVAGRRLAAHSIDFVVYHQAARSLLAGRTDLYSDSFALAPPMRYVYPPLFVLLVAPLGRLSMPDAFGVWLTLLLLATVLVVRGAVRRWWGRWHWSWALAAVLLTAPWVVYGVRSANIHLLVVLMLVAAVVAWGRGQLGRAAALVALGGAIKVFPLYLLPALLLLREWRLVARILLFSALFWSLPVLYFGPTRALELGAQWWSEVGGVERLRRESRLDVSVQSAVERWLSVNDYSTRIDPAYPQVNLVSLGGASARVAGSALGLLIASISLVAALRLGASIADPAARAAAASSLSVTAQLLLGPYTQLLYLSGWLLPVLALPAAAALQRSALPRLRAALLALGLANMALVMVPGSANHRLLEAAGAYTLAGLALWGLCVWIAARFPRRRAADPA